MDPIRIDGGRVLILDQTALPREERWIPIQDAAGMIEAIAALRVRGAPLIGIAGALGLWIEAQRMEREGRGAAGAGARALHERLRAVADRMRAVRPTAANLAWAIERVLQAGERAHASEEPWSDAIRDECLAIWEEDRAASREMARHGAALFPHETRFLTHCNTGALATGGGGTALGVLVGLFHAGRKLRVWATETRPLLQGARLTAWELGREGIPYAVISDGAAPFVIARCGIEAVVVGADRIARNGDVANKVGTFSLALAARDRGIPFVVVAPSSTYDPECPSGEAIPIEERDPGEVLSFQGIGTAPGGASAENPAFDVTPARLVTAIVTEAGVHAAADFPLRGIDTAAKYR